MALQFISGSSVSDRTGVIYRTVCRQACSHPKNRYLFLVPEQATLQVQRDLAAIHPDHVLGNIDVLSFGRLAHRLLSEQGTRKAALLDDTGKSMILRRIAGRQQQELEVFSRNLNQAGFIQELKSVVSEFSAYRVSTQVLEAVLPSLDNRPALQKKLRDIEKIYTAFYRELGERYLTAEELLALLAKLVPQSRQIRESCVILDGFTGFTPLQYQVLEELLQYARHVLCAVTEDESGGREELFAMSREMKQKLTLLAADHQVACREQDHLFVGELQKRDPQLLYLERMLFSPRLQPWEGSAVQEQKKQSVHIARASRPGQELAYVLRKVLELVREGYAYREIAIVTGDLDVYREQAQSLFDAAGIPYFIDQKKGLAAHPLVRLVKEALAVLEEQMSYDSVMAFLRNPYVSSSEYEEDEIRADGIAIKALDRLDNYLLAGGIQRTGRWMHPWALPYNHVSEEELTQLNRLRSQIFDWFVPLRTVWENPQTTVREAMAALFYFMQQFEVTRKLKQQQERFQAEGEYYLESEYAQVYAKVLGLFDQIVELMGEEKLEAGVLSDILDSGFEELQVGFIPATVDRLVVGDLMRTRLEHIRVLFVVGANDGLLPKRTERGGLLTDYDREVLKGEGLSLALPAREEAFCQQYYLYLLLTKPSEELYLSYCACTSEGKALRPAHLLSAVKRIFPVLQEEDAGSAYPGLKGLMQPEDGFALLTEGLRNYLDGKGELWW